MPGVVCDGRVVIEEVDWGEVRAILGRDNVVYLRQRQGESYDDFVRRVTDFCERNVGDA